ncbi:MAG: hypothetical protein R3E96_06475 [Planctomycetota bacterium]
MPTGRRPPFPPKSGWAVIPVMVMAGFALGGAQVEDMELWFVMHGPGVAVLGRKEFSAADSSDDGYRIVLDMVPVPVYVVDAFNNPLPEAVVLHRDARPGEEGNAPTVPPFKVSTGHDARTSIILTERLRAQVWAETKDGSGYADPVWIQPGDFADGQTLVLRVERYDAGTLDVYVVDQDGEAVPCVAVRLRNAAEDPDEADSRYASVATAEYPIRMRGVRPEYQLQVEPVRFGCASLYDDGALAKKALTLEGGFSETRIVVKLLAGVRFDVVKLEPGRIQSVFWEE